MALKSVIETVEPLLSPVISEQGCELYDIEYVKEGGDRILRLYIDKDGGVDLNDCERVSRASEAVLDDKDPIPAAYVLEVSSPGIERKLKKDSHYARYTGEKVLVRLFSPIDGRKSFNVFLYTLLFNRPHRKKSAGVGSGDRGGQRFFEIILSLKKTFNFSHAGI